LDAAGKIVPVNMGLIAEHSGIFEVINYLSGYENYCYLLKDDPELLDEMADRLGKLNLRIFSEAAEYDRVVILHMGDDIAYRSGVMASPQILRKWLFSWMKEYTAVAHKHKKLFTYHSDGNFREVAEDIIDSGVDGKQAFEEVSYNVRDFKREYGDRISVLGGIDVDLMVRLPEDEFRRYVRQVLEVCAPGGGYAIGSGNCFTSYIPIGNYMAMLDEAHGYYYK
jgi:uroporphyrinogen decarboxylase